MYYFLQSHNGIKGTARPANYFVLKNEIGLSSLELQLLTHNLCYTYVRATLGVSYASPAYYADRLCERGRCYVREWFNPSPDKRNEHKKRKDEMMDRRRKQRPPMPENDTTQKRAEARKKTEQDREDENAALGDLQRVLVDQMRRRISPKESPNRRDLLNTMY
ncbi:hypothetical protein EJ04DRAFT_508252 [Polyplosphaeria fusca]|uniref:Piwi domain-containing protein n=1 Tax=Polyplosphaeria fusca TaxID=682080 RepID=A0A9P4V8E1_9PLEO|nr:hypothetical protein EJ04DRAFT_508252 [Polyplosphaeria fusca]